jgi:hypothetical protein
MKTDWRELLSEGDWARIVGILNLSPCQADFLWHALRDSRDIAIAEHMAVTASGAHAHRMAVFRKLKVENMPAAIAQVFAAYVSARKTSDSRADDSRRSSNRTVTSASAS